MKKKKPITYRRPYSRMRTAGGLTATSMPYTVQTFFPNTSSSGSLATGGVKGWDKMMTDVVTPGYSALRKKRLWINNPVDYYLLTTSECNSSTTTSCTPNGPSYTTRTWSGDALGFLIGPLIPQGYTTLLKTLYPDVVSATYARNKAAMDCLNRIAPPSSQSLVTAAELPKTINMIAERVRKIHDAVTAVKRGDVKKLKSMFGEPPRKYAKYPKTVVLWDVHKGEPIVNSKSGKTARRWKHVPLTQRRLDELSEQAKTWLEYRYGWSPLVYDIVDQMKALDAVMRRKDRLETSGSYEDSSGEGVFKAKAKEKLSGTLSVNIPRASAHGGSYVWRREISHEVEAHAYAHYSHSVSGILSRFNDFGAFDVPRAIWELTPWSFVVDWFIPIGSWLGAITPKVGVVILASGVVERSVKTVTRTLVGYTPDYVGAGAWPDSPVALGTSDSATDIRWSRRPGISLPSYPPVEMKLNLQRMVDAVALFKRLR